MDLRSWQPRFRAPADTKLIVLARERETGRVWIGWHDADGVPCRTRVHERDLEPAAPRVR